MQIYEQDPSILSNNFMTKIARIVENKKIDKSEIGE